MHILDAAFVTSAAEPRGWPEEGPPEIAVCGRSNVGKSTLLNTLLGRKSLARVSNTPGRTRLINFFRLSASMGGQGGHGRNSELLLADLPGFGYATVSKAERATWRPLIQRYLEVRGTLRVVLLLCDARRVADRGKDKDLLGEEEDLGRWLKDAGRVVVPVLTKADKLSKHERKPAAAVLAALMGAPPVIFSALHREGIEDLGRRLEAALALSAGAAAEPRP